MVSPLVTDGWSSSHPAPPLCLLLVAAISFIPGVGTLRLEEFRMPSHLLLGQSTDLLCRYNLENETLYSVKWYKDNREFYRFIAGPTMDKKMYPLPGIRIDMSNSDHERVRLLDVDIATSGKYGCEVSVDAPSFETVIRTGHLLVVAMPESGPSIEGTRDIYHLGDTLALNCTTVRSKPATPLNWYINGQQAPYSSLVDYPVVVALDGRESRTLGIQLRLQSRHFHNGVLTLRCVASLASVYWQKTEIAIKQPAKPPAGSPAKTLEVKGHSNSAVRVTATRAVHMTWLVTLGVTLATRR